MNSPWTQVPHLASHILARAAHQLPGDWLTRYGVEPVLMETLVDPARYRGVCYRAANWVEVGMTQGRGRMDHSGNAQGVRKQIFLYPLHRHWRQRLCTTPPVQSYAALPKWRRRAARPSALDLLTLLRKEMTENPDLVAHLGLNPTDRRSVAAAAA